MGRYDEQESTIHSFVYSLFVIHGLKVVLSKTIDDNPERPASDTHVEGSCSAKGQTPFGDFIIPIQPRFKDETADFFI